MPEKTEKRRETRKDEGAARCLLCYQPLRYPGVCRNCRIERTVGQTFIQFERFFGVHTVLKNELKRSLEGITKAVKKIEKDLKDADDFTRRKLVRRRAVLLTKLDTVSKLSMLVK